MWINMKHELFTRIELPNLPSLDETSTSLCDTNHLQVQRASGEATEAEIRQNKCKSYLSSLIQLRMEGLLSIKFLLFFKFSRKFAEAKALKVCTRFVLKNHLTASYLYIRAENSSSGCTWTYTVGFVKCFDIAVFRSILKQSGQLWIKEI